MKNFSVRIADPTEIFKVIRLAPSGVMEGKDDSGRIRIVFSTARNVVTYFGHRGGNPKRYWMRDFVKPENLLLHAFLVTLNWSALGGWEGSPLELLALCGVDESDDTQS